MEQFPARTSKIRLILSFLPQYTKQRIAGHMATQRYSVTPHPIETLLTSVKSGEIAMPEIQRPFVWEATKVRNLLDW